MEMWEKQLEIRTRLNVAEYGIEQIIDLCKETKILYDQYGHETAGIRGIMNMAMSIQNRLNKMPGGKS